MGVPAHIPPSRRLPRGCSHSRMCKVTVYEKFRLEKLSSFWVVSSRSLGREALVTRALHKLLVSLGKPRSHRAEQLHLTLMRPPVVKGQRYPLSGFFACFPPGGCPHRWPAATCADVVSHAGAPTGRHHTPLEVRSPCAGRVQKLSGLVSATEKHRGALVPSSAKTGETSDGRP